MKRTLTLSALSVIAVLTFGMAGCAPEDTSITAPTETAAQATVPTEASDPTAGLMSGDVIDEAAAAELNAAYGRANDDRGYQLPSGEWVLLRGGEPLPARVVEAVHASVAPIIVGSSMARTSESDPDLADAFEHALVAQEQATGRTFTVVLHAMSYEGGQMVPVWAVGRNVPDPQNSFSKDEIVAIGQAWVDKAPATRGLLIIDVFG